MDKEPGKKILVDPETLVGDDVWEEGVLKSRTLANGDELFFSPTTGNITQRTFAKGKVAVAFYNEGGEVIKRIDDQGEEIPIAPKPVPDATPKSPAQIEPAQKLQRTSGSAVPLVPPESLKTEISRELLEMREKMGESFVEFCRGEGDAKRTSELKSFLDKAGLDLEEVTECFRITGEEVGVQYYFVDKRGEQASPVEYVRLRKGMQNFLFPKAVSKTRFNDGNMPKGFKLEERQKGSLGPDTISYSLPALLRGNKDRWEISEEGVLSNRT